MKESIKISIVTVSYNAAKTIEQTISSVVNQTYKNIEYIIIDGGSTDGTIDVIKKYEDRISYWVSEPDKGIYDAMNKGTRAATGDYIQFIGADDCLVDETVIDMVAKDIIATKADIYSYGVLLVDEGSKKEKYKGNKHARNNPYNCKMVPHNGTFVKRDIQLNNLFDTSYKISADYKFFLQWFRAEYIKVLYYDVPIVYFSLSGVGSVDRITGEKEDRRVFQEMGITYPEDHGARYYVREFLRGVKLLSFCRSVRDNFVWKKHHCKNKICRWCDRYNS